MVVKVELDRWCVCGWGDADAPFNVPVRLPSCQSTSFSPTALDSSRTRYPKRNFDRCGCRMVGWQRANWLRLCWACFLQRSWLSLVTSCTALKILTISALQPWSR